MYKVVWAEPGALLYYLSSGQHDLFFYALLLLYHSPLMNMYISLLIFHAYPPFSYF